VPFLPRPGRDLDPHGRVRPGTSGNSDTLNVNGKFALHGEDETWLHDYYALALRSETDDQTTANRYEFGGRTDGSDNTFLQNDVGVQVAMSNTLALKAGYQVRHNTDVVDGVDKTDTLALINLVWSAPPPE
jgi:putative salt-induced outer membrane protein YdiY